MQVPLGELLDVSQELVIVRRRPARLALQKGDERRVVAVERSVLKDARGEGGGKEAECCWDWERAGEGGSWRVGLRFPES